MVSGFLSGDSRMTIVGQATSGIDAIKLVPTLKPDIVLMDISMPIMNGFEATRELKQENPSVHIVMLTLHDTPGYRSESQIAGADGFICKSECGKELISLIEQVATLPRSNRDNDGSQTM